MSTFILQGDICYCSAAERSLRTMPNGYLVCLNGLSAGVWSELPPQYQTLPRIDYSGKLIIPGLVDLHTHAPQFSFRGLGMDMEIMDWLRAHTFPEESRYSDLEYAKRAYGLAVKHLLCGPNTRMVLYATPHTPATILLMEQMECSGLVSYVGRVNIDRNAPDSLREADAQASLRETRQWLTQTCGAYQNTYPILTPRFIPCCTDNLMRGLAQLQKEFRVPLQSHLSESLGEINLVRELCPGTRCYGNAYHELGLMCGFPTIMAHCVWSNQEETELLMRSGTFVAHCPQSNANLSSGIAPVRRYLRQGLKMGLGSDVAGGCHPSIFRAMTDAIQVSKLRWQLVDRDDLPLTFTEAFHMATMGGGAFFGQVGSFDTGYELDALVIDDGLLASTGPHTLAERLERVAYLSDDRHIIEKYVRGKRLFEQLQ